MRPVSSALPLLLAVALAAGCGGAVEGGGGTASLDGTRWVLRSGLDVEGWEAAVPTAAFADGTLAGSTGCNTFSASYRLDGKALEVGAVASTKRACAPPADAVERAYVAALGRVAGWRSEGGDLVLVDAGGAPLLRYAPA